MKAAAWTSASGRCSSRDESVDKSSGPAPSPSSFFSSSSFDSLSSIFLTSISRPPLVSLEPASLFLVVTRTDPWAHSGMCCPSPSGPLTSCVSSALSITISHRPRSFLSSHIFTSGSTSVLASPYPGTWHSCAIESYD